MRFSRTWRRSWSARAFLLGLLYLLVGPSLDLDFDGSLVRAWFSEQSATLQTDDRARVAPSPWLPAATPLPADRLTLRSAAATLHLAPHARLSSPVRYGPLPFRPPREHTSSRADAPADPA